MHAASGMLTRNFVPKPAYYAVVQMQRLLGAYRFKRVVTEQPGAVMVYEFEHGEDKSIHLGSLVTNGAPYG